MVAICVKQLYVYSILFYNEVFSVVAKNLIICPSPTALSLETGALVTWVRFKEMDLFN